MVFLQGRRLVDASVVDAVVGGDDDEQVLPGRRLLQAFNEIRKAVVDISEGVLHLVALLVHRHVPRLVGRESGVAKKGSRPREGLGGGLLGYFLI